MEGTRLGPYQLLAELGSGGMGKVYRAEVVGPAPGLDAGGAVALKVIHAHLLETPGFFKRFLREADIGRTIEHANVVRTYDCDALLLDGTQQNFLVMEYVEGQTLRDLLKELERVPEELCRHIGREVAKGLAAIHEAGVVHRDLKPENVIITPDHVVKIMDLGVARLQAEAVRLSQTGAFVGSLEYAAPEQFGSSDGEPDGRADLHALGVVLYELATGQHPYRDEDTSRVIGRILNDVPRKAGEVNAQLSPFFEEVVHTLIAKDRNERFAAASDLAAVLDDGEKSAWWKARAKALRVETKRPLRRIRIPRETALYGRDEDLSRLHALYDLAKAGDGRVLLIEGEAGIGKTRLVDEFVGRLRQDGEDINFLFGSYPPGGAATAAGAFSTAYLEHLGGEDLEKALAEHLTGTPLLVPAFAALLKGDATPAGAQPLTRDSLQAVFVHATRSLASERTTIVLIDDLHFAPEDGRALFSSLATAVPGHRILLLGTMRPGVPQEWTAGITRLDHAEQRSLSRLGPKDLFSLLKDSFRSDRLAQELGMQISLKCDGNPFFAFEIIRGLREGQFISKQPDGTWVTTKVIQDIQVPSSVLDLIEARLRGLCEEERELLDVASCFGFEFEPGLVAEVVGLERIPALRAFGRVEAQHRLVRSAGRRYLFDHHQVQETLYAGLHDELREAYHVEIAQALEARTGAADTDAEQLDGVLCVGLCEHFLEGAQGQRALRYLDAALTHLERGFLNDQVIALMDRALSEPGLLRGAERVELLFRKNQRLGLLGSRDAQAEVLAEARALVDGEGDRALRAKLECHEGLLLQVTGRYQEAQARLEAGRSLARELGDRSTEARATGNLGNTALALGRAEDAQAYFEQHLTLARELGRRDDEAFALGNLGNAFLRLHRFEEAQACYEQHLAIARELGDRRSESGAIGSLGSLFLNRERFDEAQRYYEQHLAMAHEIGDRRGVGSANGNLGNLLWVLGRYEEGHVCVERHLAIAREIGDRQGEATAAGNLGNLLSGLGRVEEARAYYELNLAIAREVGDRRNEARAIWSLGSLAWSDGRYEEAGERFEEYLQVVRETGDRRSEASATGNLGLYWLALGAPGRARESLEAALALNRELGVRSGEVHWLVASSTLAEEEGAEHALERATAGLALARDVGYLEGLALALTRIGELRLRSGEVDGAREALREAADLQQKPGAKGGLALTLALLARLPGGDAAAAEAVLAEAPWIADTPEVRCHLWKATRKREHLAEAKRLLDYRVEHAPEAYRESMLRNVRLNREIMEAWAEHGEQPVGEGEAS